MKKDIKTINENNLHKKLGLFCQFILWSLLIFVVLVFATSGFEINEFRYVGF